MRFNLPAITHIQDKEYIYPADRNRLCFRLKCARKDIDKCTLIYWKRAKSKHTDQKATELKCVLRDGLSDYLETVIAFDTTARYIKYYFKIEKENSIIWYSAYGFSETEPKEGYFEYLYANDNDGYNIPSWTRNQIYYQIFPERFCNGDITNDPSPVEKWGTLPTRENFMGGDLKGICDKINYIRDLGVTCLYLNPIFEAPSNHKYDTVNYFNIDPSFGTKEELIQLVALCHENNIKVVLDGVFNHCGYYFPAFQDVIAKGRESRYWDWFYIKDYPINTERLNYECVGDYMWMPKLRVSNPEVAKYFIEVGLYWIKEANIDGWRLDVADELDSTFWQHFRREIKLFKPEAILIGETWGDGRKLLKGDQMDSVMNYVFRDAIKDFIATRSISSSQLDQRLNKMLASYSKEVNYAMYNLLDSHDTPRFLFECQEDTLRFKLAVAFQMTFLGSPAIYYGDEIGISADNDPDCRRAMSWCEEEQDKELTAWYKKMTTIRNKLSVLRDGWFTSNLCLEKDNIYGFIRYNQTESAYIVINNSNAAREIIIPVLETKEKFIDFISGNELEGRERTQTGYYNDDITVYRSEISTVIKAWSVMIITKNEKGE